MSQTSERPMIAAENVTKQVRSGGDVLTILEAISLEIAASTTAAIVGPSGSGKSTLLGLLAGLDSPTAGTVSLDGQTLSAMDEDDRARARAGRVGFVFQSFQLLPGLTALENVQLPLELAGDMAAKDIERAARTALESVGLAHRLTHRPSQLSGGEQQRVAIARAFAPQPSVLFADEPTGNLDAKTGGDIEDLLFRLNKEAGTTLLMVTHDERLAERCGRVLGVEGGRLV